MEKIVIIDDETEIFSLKTEISKALNSLNREIDLYYSRPEDTAEIISRLKDTHTVIVTKATTKINNDVIENLPSLKHIAVFGTALDHIDENAAKRNGIAISSIPNSFTMSVAEHTMALMFSLIKKIPEIKPDHVLLGLILGISLGPFNNLPKIFVENYSSSLTAINKYTSRKKKIIFTVMSHSKKKKIIIKKKISAGFDYKNF